MVCPTPHLKGGDAAVDAALWYRNLACPWKQNATLYSYWFVRPTSKLVAWRVWTELKFGEDVEFLRLKQGEMLFHFILSCYRKPLDTAAAAVYY